MALPAERISLNAPSGLKDADAFFNDGSGNS